MGKFKSFLKSSIPTIIYFGIVSGVFFMLPIGLFLMVGMSTDSSMNSCSIYILEDVLTLIQMFFMPFIIIAIFYTIPGLILFIFRKKIKFNLYVYVLLMFLYSLPFSLMLLPLHANTSLEYKVEREKELLINKGYMIDGTEWYDICARYLNTTDEAKLKALLELDSTVLTYDYRYITNYMDYIQFTDEKVAIKRLEDYFGVDYTDDYYVVFDKSLLELSEILTKLRLEKDINVNTIHNKLNAFISKRANTRGDNYGIDDDLERTIPLMVTFENIKLLNDVSYVSSKSEYMQDLYLKAELDFAKTRVKMFVEGNAYDYQHGYTVTIEDNNLYLNYLQMLDTLLNKDNLSASYVKDVLDKYNKDNGLNVRDRELNIMQIFFNPITLEEIEIQNEKEY